MYFIKGQTQICKKTVIRERHVHHPPPKRFPFRFLPEKQLPKLKEPTTLKLKRKDRNMGNITSTVSNYPWNE